MPHAKSSSKRRASKKRKDTKKSIRSTVKAVVKAALSQQIESKYEMSSYLDAKAQWNSGHHGVQLEVDFDLASGSGPHQAIGQEIFLQKLECQVVLVPGKQSQLLGMSTADPPSYTVNPFQTPRQFRYAIVMQDRTVAANQAGNFFDVMNAQWTPKGLFGIEDFEENDNVMALLKGTRILKRGTFMPKYNRISCTPDGSSASKTRCLSIPSQSLFSISAVINKKILLQTNAPKNASQWVFSLYISDYDGTSDTYSPYVDPSTLLVRHLFTYQDA